jgi:hypothetical protein
MLDWLFGSSEAESGAESDDGDDRDDGEVSGYMKSDSIVGALVRIHWGQYKDLCGMVIEAPKTLITRLTGWERSDVIKYSSHLVKLARHDIDWNGPSYEILESAKREGAWDVLIPRENFDVRCSNASCERSLDDHDVNDYKVAAKVLFTCSSCGRKRPTVWYCCRNCAKADIKRHQAECAGSSSVYGAVWSALTGQARAPTEPRAAPKKAARSASGASGAGKTEELCVICYAREQTHLFNMCGHLGFCGPCAATRSDCPICRTPGKGIKVFRVTSFGKRANRAHSAR